MDEKEFKKIVINELFNGISNIDEKRIELNLTDEEVILVLQFTNLYYRMPNNMISFFNFLVNQNKEFQISVLNKLTLFK